MTNLDKLSTLGSLGRWDSTGLTKYALTVSESRGRASGTLELLDKMSMLTEGTGYDTCCWSDSREAASTRAPR